MAEKTKVKLVNKGKEPVEYDIQHAENLLALQERNKISDWELAAGSGFEFKDGAISPTGKGTDKDTAKPGKP